MQKDGNIFGGIKEIVYLCTEKIVGYTTKVLV